MDANSVCLLKYLGVCFFRIIWDSDFDYPIRRECDIQKAELQGLKAALYY